MSEETKVELATVEASAAPELTHDAFGIYKEPKTGEWVVVIIEYSPISGEAKMGKSIPTGGYREMAIDKFKIEAAQMLYADTNR